MSTVRAEKKMWSVDGSVMEPERSLEKKGLFEQYST